MSEQAPRSRSSVLVNLQFLRFIAALLVVLSHISARALEMQERYGFEADFLKFSGSLGVAIFFVISGFIMVYVAGGEFGKPSAPLRFLKNRVLRIVPLYWMLTALQVAWIVFAASRNPEEVGRFTPEYLVKSLAFIPYINANGDWRPLLEQGWTLNFEMMFYAIFAVCLALPRVMGLVAILAALAGIGAASTFHVRGAIGFLLDPIVLYFGAGILLALLRQRLERSVGLPKFPVPMLTVFALALLTTVTYNVIGFEIIPQALIALAVVAIASVCQDVNLPHRLRGWVTYSGDISYSLYLSHGFVLVAAGIVWRKLFGGDHLLAYAGITVILTILGAAACYQLFERPIAGFFKRRQRNRAAAIGAA